MEGIRFDDLQVLGAQVSDEFGDFGPTMEVTQEMINTYADLSGDRQWIHVDVERAQAESPFGGPIAHGFLTLSLLPRLLPTTSMKVIGHASAVNYGAESLRFLSPVLSGSKLHARCRPAKVELKPGGTLVTTEWDIRVVGAERPAVLYRMQILYRG